MARVILACGTLKRELKMVMDRLSCSDPVIWLEAGDHNQPKKRRRAIEMALEDCCQYDTVILAMSFCGNALVGLNSGNKTVLLPCFDDCLSLLLAEKRRQDVYYLTDGWLDGQRNIREEYRNALKKYGEEKTGRIFHAMLRGYRSVAWVDTGCGTADGKRKARETAVMLGLHFEEVTGTLSNLEDLLLERDAGHVLRIPPNTEITLQMRRGMIPVTVSPEHKIFYALPGENLLNLLRRNGLMIDAPCGGAGSCGKCIVYIDDLPQRACGIRVDEPISLRLRENLSLRILSEEKNACCTAVHPVAAVDIGTTSLVCSLLDMESGNRLAAKGVANPQRAYGADVVTRIRAALSGSMEAQTQLIRNAVAQLIRDCCTEAQIKPETVEKIIIAGNPAMEQLFLGISPQNLVEIPFHPVLTEPKPLNCADYLRQFPDASLLAVPNISGYIGGDTVGCIVSEKLPGAGKMTLLADIGTNGEMVLAGGNRMVACATAAGPALEGANILFGMRACDGAIDHVWLEEGEIRFTTIGNELPAGICGSGLIDAVAVFLELGHLSPRGRIAPELEKDGDRKLTICDGIWLTQEDIRQVQLAKGAIAAGIRLLMKHLDVTAEEIDSCLLAGAFGTYMNPENACRIGLIPAELRGKVQPVGNAALRGAEEMVLQAELYQKTRDICRNTEVLELASLADFPKTYAKSMNF